MDHLVIDTASGPLGFVGRFLTDRPRPALLAVTGSFPPKDHLHELITAFLDANVLIVQLPGMAGMFWANDPDVAGLTRGLEGAARKLLGDAPIVALGASTGNLLSLGLGLPNICHRVALEPFLQTGDLWPLIADSRERLKLNPGFWPMSRFLWNMFGVAEDRVENRDYRYLLDGIAVPTDVLVGYTPLAPQRELESWPSLTSEADRTSLRANPWVTLHEGPRGSGHAYGADPATFNDLKRVVGAALGEAAKLSA